MERIQIRRFKRYRMDVLGWFFFFFLVLLQSCLSKSDSLLTLFPCCDFWKVYLDSEINFTFLSFGLDIQDQCFFFGQLLPRCCSGKESTCRAGAIRDTGSIPGSGRSCGVGNGNHFSILAWEIPWTEEPGGLQSMGLQRVGCDWTCTHAP